MNKYKSSINLIPQEYRDKAENKIVIALALVIIAIAAIIAGYYGVQYFMADRELKKVNAAVEDISGLKSEITSVEDSIKSKRESLTVVQDKFLDFEMFMNALYEYKPASVTLISVDSEDRLPQSEGEGSEGSRDGGAGSGFHGEGTGIPEVDESLSPAMQAAQENAEANGGTVSTGSEIVDSAIDAAAGAIDGVTNTIQQEKDITDKNIYLRGYSVSSDDIADYIYKISYLECVEDITLTSIENRIDSDGQATKVFEVVINTTEN